jgi:hypothetical protein
MADIVYMYPKNSCPNATCGNKYSFPIGDKGGNATNFSVRGCSVPDFYTCYDRAELSTSVQPKGENQDLVALNPQVYSDKIAEGFHKISCKTQGSAKGSAKPDVGCVDPTYFSWDPRQFDPVRAQHLFLDLPPIDGDVRLKDVYDKRYKNYGSGSMPYKDIKDGQIMYYIDKSIEDAFYKPVYSEPAKESSVLFKDPMGAMKPEYNRTPLINTTNPTTTTPKSYPYCLSFIQDSQSFREDIMALQQRKHNQEKYSARWANLNGM